MSESDTMFNKRDQRCAAVQLMLSTDPSYDTRTIARTLKMQIWIATNNRGVPRVMKTKFLATVMVFEVGLKVNTKVYLDVLQSVVQSGSRSQTLGVVAGLGAGPQVQRDPGLATEGVLRFGTYDSAPSSPNLNQLDYFVWSYVENITNMTSHNTKASLIAAIRRVFVEFPPALVEKYALSSGSVSRW